VDSARRKGRGRVAKDDGIVSLRLEREAVRRRHSRSEQNREECDSPGGRGITGTAQRRLRGQMAQRGAPVLK